MSEQRFETMEIKIAYMEELLESLNRTVADQQMEIVKLTRTCERLNEKILALRDASSQSSGHERPPHY
jgi:SlyX protein